MGLGGADASGGAIGRAARRLRGAARGCGRGCWSDDFDCAHNLVYGNAPDDHDTLRHDDDPVRDHDEYVDHVEYVEYVEQHEHDDAVEETAAAIDDNHKR